MANTCACGCGREIPEKPHHKRNPPKFIHGHNQRGQRSGRWTGGRTLNSHGYWMVWAPEHPNAGAKGYVAEHRLIWEQTHGRLLERWEHVHHIDGDRTNNDPSNLVALTKSEHSRLHRDDPQEKRTRSERLAQRWQDPEFRSRTVESMRRHYRERTGPSDEERSRKSAASKRKWEDPELRARMSGPKKRRKPS